jgi:hypothetical protein
MTTLKVRNLLAVEKLDLPLDGITLVVGPNEAGKTTVANAAAACLTGNPLLRGIKAKTHLAPVVMNGQEIAQALIQNDAGAREVAWPEGKVKTKGDPPTSSEIAAGQKRLSALSPAERATALIDLLKASPTADDLEKAFAAINLAAEAAQKIWVEIEASGWDGAAQKVKERGTMLKGQWEEVTKERFGIKKAEQWFPTNWDISLTDTPADELETLVQKAKARVDEMIGKEAVATANLEALRDQAAQLEHYRNNLGQWTSDITILQEDLNAAVDARAKLPSASTDRGIPCPYPQCEGRRLRITSGAATRGLACVDENEQLSEDEHKERLNAIATADGKVANLRGQVSKMEQDMAAAERLVAESEQAKEVLKKMGGPEIAAALESAKTALQTATEHFQMAKTKQEADYKLRQIKNMVLALDVLGPTGLRQQVLGKSLKGFSKKHLAPLCRMANLPPIVIAEDTLEISAGEHPYYLLSRGAQHAVDCILQVAIAQMDGSSMLVIDDADKLVGDLRKGFFSMLAESHLSALVCLAAKPEAKVPDLAQMGLGRTVWLGSASRDTEKE